MILAWSVEDFIKLVGTILIPSKGLHFLSGIGTAESYIDRDVFGVATFVLMPSLILIAHGFVVTIVGF